MENIWNAFTGYRGTLSHGLMWFLGKLERRSIASDDRLVVCTVGRNRDTMLIRLISEKTASTLGIRAFLIRLALLCIGDVC